VYDDADADLAATYEAAPGPGLRLTKTAKASALYHP
jgi:hypothetical protein